MENNNSNQNPAANNNMAVGILSYLGILWIVAFIIHGNGKTAFGAYHLRQGLGLLIITVALWILLTILTMLFFSLGMLGIIGILSTVLWLSILVFVILGIVNAAQNKMAPLPIIGPMFEKWFAGIQ
jgi:uncharacterized membrane protein